MTTLWPAGMVPIAPKRQKSLSCEAAWPSRFQFAVFMACQMPFRFGLPPIRGRFCASARERRGSDQHERRNQRDDEPLPHLAP